MGEKLPQATCVKCRGDLFPSFASSMWPLTVRVELPSCLLSQRSHSTQMC